MKNILIIGNANQIFTLDYIKNVLFDYKVVLLSYTNYNYREWYSNNNIEVYEYKCDSNVKIVKFICEILKVRKIWKKLNEFDYIQYHCVCPFDLIKTWYIGLLHRRMIMTFWGSDILSANRWAFFLYKPFLKKAYSINMLTQNMLTKFKMVYGKRYNKKLTCFDFGCPMYEKIDEIKRKYTKEECKSFFGFDTSKYIIQIGYNNNREQKHIDILNALSKVNRDVLDRCQFVCQLSYGNSTRDYVDEIETMLKNMNVSYIMEFDYLNPEEISMFRYASDLFLYAQTTDALSASVIEYMYADCVVTKPIWLSYFELDENKIQYIEYSNIDDLGVILDDFIRRPQYYRDIVGDNIGKLQKMNDWSVVRQSWRDIYFG